MYKASFFFGTMSFNSWALLVTWLHIGAPQKIHETMDLQPILNNNLPCAHTKLEFDMLDVTRKLVKF
jgi:hypothetical protein